MFIYLNGQMVEKEAAMISPFDHGFLYGLGLFETFRVYEGHPFLLDDHLERINHGLSILNINYRFYREETNNILQALLEKNNFTNAYIRLNVSAGSGDIGLQTEPFLEPNLIIFPKELPLAGELFEKKATLLKLKRNTPEGEARLKSHHFMNNLLAKREIGPSLEQEGIFLTADGHLAEGIVSNIFWIKDKELYTPALCTGILNGITRQFVIELAGRIGLCVKEGLYTLEQALDADEMFVTNSIQEIVPISSFEARQLPGKKGHWVQRFHQDYRKFCQSLWTRNGLRRD
ncbi:aminodeoxychorismate lyase [Neobacillus bataviensis]|uniref:aminodeoxychorismate lyase n=1 Tax=Neobacillus bataviensis TaxID=220685 RepID=UPI001CC14C5A|nr:aminodeoxychorismate lyase [Neobacillus bataviensis]